MRVKIILENIIRVCLLVVMVVGSATVLADQKIKTKSNIKNDRVAHSSASGNCVDNNAAAAAVEKDKTSDEQSSTPATSECESAKAEAEPVMTK